MQVAYTKEELKEELEQSVYALEKVTPKALVEKFWAMADLPSFYEKDDDEILIEAFADSYYDSYSEAYEEETMKLHLVRQFAECGEYYQLGLTIEFEMIPYFKKYEMKTKHPFLELIKTLHQAAYNKPKGNSLFITSPRHKKKADELIEDVLTHGKYLRYDIGMIDAE